MLMLHLAVAYSQVHDFVKYPYLTDTSRTFRLDHSSSLCEPLTKASSIREPYDRHTRHVDSYYLSHLPEQLTPNGKSKFSLSTIFWLNMSLL